MSAHLHVHTDNSLLDGAIQLSHLWERLEEIGHTSVGKTDHGTMMGTYSFHEQALSRGVKPIIGMEAYLAQRSRFDKDRSPYHLLLIAKNRAGYNNLVKLSSIAHMEGFYYKPRIDWDVLERHSEGLIVTSGCMGSEIPQILEQGKVSGDYESAIKRACSQMGRYVDIWGGDFYVELQPNKSHYEYNDTLNDLAQQVGAKIVATTDAHYARSDDYDVHDTILCMQTRAKKATPKENRFAFATNDFYLMDDNDLKRRLSGYEIAVDNTQEVSDKVEIYDLSDGSYQIPEYHVPEGYTTLEFFDELIQMGAQWRYGDRADTHDVQSRIEHERKIITKMGFVTYFLICWDVSEFARSNGILHNVRGSGAGSIIAYCLGITSIEPLSNGLFFERFLNPSRVSMPDIDFDFPDSKRQMIFDYTAKRYGRDRVAAIITKGTMKAKGAWKGVARVYGLPFDLQGEISDILGEDIQSTTTTIRDHLQNNEVLKARLKESPRLLEIMEEASRMEGMPNNVSVHPAGVIVAPTQVDDYVPVMRMPGDAHNDTHVDRSTQYDMNVCERMGLLKIDYLGLATLSILSRACELIEKRHGDTWSFDTIPYRHGDTEHDDMLDAAFELISGGNTAGVFQVEGAQISQMFMKMQPTEFPHIVAGISLFRPGPMQYIDNYIDRMHGREEVTYKHDKLRPILEETEAIVVYQEQLMKIATDLFGYDPGDADLIRKAVSKKKEKELMVHEERFLKGGTENGLTEDESRAIWEDYVDFARYGFNRAHATSYAALTVMTAFVKAHYPIEYITALMSAYYGKDRFHTIVRECRENKITLLPPSINSSSYDFEIEDLSDGTRAIRYGFGNIKFVGDAHTKPIVAERERGGAFSSFADFVNRVNVSKLNSRMLENMVLAGVFDEFEYSREQLLNAIPQLVASGKATGKRKKLVDDENQMDIFDLMDAGDDLTVSFDIEDYLDNKTYASLPEREMLGKEKELLGLYITGRPIDRYGDEFRSANTSEIVDLKNDDEFVGHRVAVGGEVVRVHEIFTKKGDKMCFADLEDWRDTVGTMTLVVFPSVYDKIGDSLREGSIVVSMGKLDNSRGEMNMLVDNIEFLNFESVGA